MSSTRDLNRVVEMLRGADIQQLEALESMPKQKLQHFLKDINASDMASEGNILRTKNLIQTEKKSRRTLLTNEKKKFTNDGLPSQKKVNNMGSLIGLIGGLGVPKSAAIFDIVIKRVGATIAANLPLPTFGTLDKESNYIDIISNLLPAGVTYIVEKSATGKGLKFTYTDGVNTDYITVECAQVPYLNLLRGSQGSILRFAQTKINISDVTTQEQFTNAVWFKRNSIFGKQEQDSFTGNQFKSDLQNQNDMRTVTIEFDVDQEMSVVYLIAPKTNFTVTQTSYISSFETPRA